MSFARKTASGLVEGETLGGRIVKGEAFTAIRPQQLARQCGQILTRIHALDLAGFPSLKRSTPQSLLARWFEAYRATAWQRPVFELAFRWLGQNCPPPPKQPHLVHGDFRNGNLMIGQAGVCAVLDWELAHVGDPMEDLGWICVNSWRFGRADKIVGGFGDHDDLFAGYEAAGGATVDRAVAKWWEVFGSLKWGVMCSGHEQRFPLGRSVGRAGGDRSACLGDGDRPDAAVGGLRRCRTNPILAR